MNNSLSKNNIGYKKAFTLVEMLIVISIVAFLSILVISLSKSIPAFRTESYTNKYCELIDSAVTAAAAANRVNSIKNVTILQMAPYLKGTLSNNQLSITMTDNTVITKNGNDFVATFPGNLTNTYTISSGKGLDCVIGDPIPDPVPDEPEPEGEEPIVVVGGGSDK
ncbi:type II secretion system protein [bacterium]|nr:type II secretion system protein [bacterium]